MSAVPSSFAEHFMVRDVSITLGASSLCTRDMHYHNDFLLLHRVNARSNYQEYNSLSEQP